MTKYFDIDELWEEPEEMVGGMAPVTTKYEQATVSNINDAVENLNKDNYPCFIESISQDKRNGVSEINQVRTDNYVQFLTDNQLTNLLETNTDLETKTDGSKLKTILKTSISDSEIVTLKDALKAYLNNKTTNPVRKNELYVILSVFNNKPPGEKCIDVDVIPDYFHFGIIDQDGVFVGIATVSSDEQPAFELIQKEADKLKSELLTQNKNTSPGNIHDTFLEKEHPNPRLSMITQKRFCCQHKLRVLTSLLPFKQEVLAKT